MDVYVGFDSAWTDNAKAPGAVCVVSGSRGHLSLITAPKLASFAETLALIREMTSDCGTTLVAIDQPTVVPNLTSMRPVERVAASLISWMGGGVQPSNRGRLGMFCDASPIWKFLTALGAKEDPEEAAVAEHGLYFMEVFPALALASMEASFFGRLKGPRYNPARVKTFRPDDWRQVALVASKDARDLGCPELAEWCLGASRIIQPRKADQDRLDSVLCVLIALRWRLLPRLTSLFLGDLETGYMVLPATQEVRDHLSLAARVHSVAMDGVVF